MILSFALESLLFLRLSFPIVLKSFGSCQVVHRPGIKLKVLMKCGTGKIHSGHELTRQEAQSWSDKMSENISQYRISNRFYSFLSSAPSHDNYFLMFHSRLIIELYHASLSHNKANFPTKIYNQFAWTVGVTALLRSLLTSRGDGTPTHDWRGKLRVIISDTFAEFLRENLRHGDRVRDLWESRFRWFDHVKLNIGFCKV